MAKCCQVVFRDGDVALGDAWFCKGIALLCEGKVRQSIDSRVR